jgi:PII-like signaling protein
MNNLSALCLYLNYYARLRRKTFWQQLITPSMTYYLASRAKEIGIQQVIIYRVSAGFLNGAPLISDYSDIPPPKLPQCVELIDYEGMLRLFIEENRTELKDVKIVLFKCDKMIPELL